MKMRVKVENEVYEVEIADLDARPVVATIGDESFEVFPEETQAAPRAAVVISAPAPSAPVAAAPVAAAPVAAGAGTVTAPLPGVVVGISVKVGDKVNQGQELLALEAMKMKNLIRATRTGTVTAIHVSVSDHVKHGQALVDVA